MAVRDKRPHPKLFPGGEGLKSLSFRRRFRGGFKGLGGAYCRICTKAPIVKTAKKAKVPYYSASKNINKD
jgi:hypothetical protein